MRCTKDGFPRRSAWKSRLVLNLGQREDHHGRGGRRHLPESRGGSWGDRHVMLAADLAGDNTATDGASRIAAIQHTAVATMQEDMDSAPVLPCYSSPGLPKFQGLALPYRLRSLARCSRFCTVRGGGLAKFLRVS